MFGLDNLKVGDKATIHGPYGSGPVKVSKVKSIGKLKITLEDGSMWKVNGGLVWGHPWSYGGSSLSIYREGDEDIIETKILRDKLADTKFDRVPLETLRQLWAIVSALPENEKGR
jgi:hypothetical protein